MPKFRTKKNERTAYIYKDAYGRKIEIIPGMEGDDGQVVTTDHIVMLHDWDDDEHNTVKQGDYYGVTRYEQDSVVEGETVSDRNIETADHDADPARILIDVLDAAERSGAFKAEWDAMTDKQRNLVKLLLRRIDTRLAREKWEALTDEERLALAKKITRRSNVALAETEWDALTDRHRSLVMKELLWISNKEIADELNCSIEAFRSCLAKVQKRFEKFLK